MFQPFQSMFEALGDMSSVPLERQLRVALPLQSAGVMYQESSVVFPDRAESNHQDGFK